jgi:CheY-like chemotaxis protein
MLISKLQKILFTAIMVPLVILIAIIELNNYIDAALLLYGLIVLTVLLILGHWVYWWKRSKERSIIFIVNGLLLASIVLSVSAQFFVRYLFVYDNTRLFDLLKSDWWAYRIAPEAIVLIWLLSWILSRMYGKGEDTECYIDVDGTPIDTKKLNVLVIDDNVSTTNSLRSQLIDLKKYNVFVANTTEKGLECFKERKYFLVLLDLKFGNDFTGSENLAIEMRKLDKYVWITVLTGFIGNAYNQKLLECVDDIVAKPLSLTDLKAYLLLWNLKFRRRMYYIKDFERKFDCYGDKLKDICFILKNGKKGDDIDCE